MGGLLYKDFVAVKGKLMVLIWTGVIIAFTVLRMMFTGYGAGSAWRMEDATGQMTNLVDAYFLTFYCMILLIMLFQVNQYEGSIVEGDRKNKVLNYFNSMPIGKNTYYASKYIFLGIVIYVFMSLAFILQIICAAFCDEGPLLDYLEMVAVFIIPLFSFTMFMASIELPLYVIWGKDKAMMAKDIFILIVAYIVVGYLFFGDLAWVDKVNPHTITMWVEKHQFGISLVEMLAPVLVLGLYYLSYRVTCYLGKGEVTVND